MSANTKLVGWLIGAALLLAGVVTVPFVTFRQLEATAEARQRNNALLQHSNELMAAVVDAETSQRGFLLTGEELFLEHYLRVKDRLRDDLAALHVGEGPGQQHLDALAPLIDRKLKYFEHNLELRRADDLPAALVFVRGPDGKPLMDAIRAEMNAFKREVELDRDAREAAFQSSMTRLSVILVIASLLMLGIGLAIAWLIRRQTAERLQREVHLVTQQALATLQVSEEKLAVTLNSIGDAVIATDAQANVTLLNKEAEKLTGWTRAEAAGRPIGEIFHIINEETRQLALMPVKATLEHGTTQALVNHTLLIARGGDEFPIADSCAPIRERSGKVVGAVLVFRDVSNDHANQRALHQKNVELLAATAVAEKANLAKSEFLSSMSHELRSPLNAILGFAQLMESDPVMPTAAQSLGISQILKAGWHLLTLINEILDLARVESGQVPLSKEPVSLGEVLAECHDMLAPQAQLRGIELIFPQITVPSFVRADRTRLKQVLINLLFNAIKYNTANGTVTVTYGLPTPESARVTIEDTGAGLSPAQVGQLFQAFNRLGQESGGVEGTGIGLVVSKRLVELMGGTIGVESTPGQGSRFWFELTAIEGPKLTEEEAARLKLTQPVAVSMPARTVLYVEDNPANLLLVKQILARLPGIRLLTASDGYTGIECARASRPDVILMDINLPGINGVDAMKLLRSDPATMRIPVLALSANALARDVEKGLEAGFFRYITKPINVNEFIRSLNLALDVGSPAKA